MAEADVEVDRVVEQGVEAAHADEGRGPEALQERVVHEVRRDERVLFVELCWRMVWGFYV